MIQDQQPGRKGGAGHGRRASLLFFAAVLAVAVALLLASRLSRKTPGAVALLQYGDPQQELRIPLDTDKIYDVDTGDYTIHLQVADGTIAFIDSPCPDHVCESFGKLKNAGDWAACLPAKAMLTIPDE